MCISDLKVWSFVQIATAHICIKHFNLAIVCLILFQFEWEEAAIMFALSFADAVA